MHEISCTARGVSRFHHRLHRIPSTHGPPIFGFFNFSSPKVLFLVFKKSITSATLHSFLLFVCLLLFLFFFHFIFSLYDEQSWRIRIDIRAKRAFSLSRLQLYVFGSLVCIISFTEQFHKNTSERGMYAVIYVP